MMIRPILPYSGASVSQNKNKFNGIENNLTFTGVNCLKNLTNVKPQNKLLGLFNKLFSSKTSKLAAGLPIVSAPVLLYDLRNTHLKKLLDEMKNAGVEIPRYFSASPVSDSGLDEASKQAFRNKVNEAARTHKIDEETKNDLLHRITFTGAPEENGVEFVDGDLDVDLDVSESSDGIFDAIGDFISDLFN